MAPLAPTAQIAEVLGDRQVTILVTPRHFDLALVGAFYPLCLPAASSRRSQSSA